MHKGLATEDAEETVSQLLGLVDDAIHRINREGLLRRRNIDPTTLTAEVTTVDDGEVEERREVLTRRNRLLKR